MALQVRLAQEPLLAARMGAREVNAQHPALLVRQVGALMPLHVAQLQVAVAAALLAVVEEASRLQHLRRAVRESVPLHVVHVVVC